MSPSDEEMNRQGSEDDISNPFIAFRRFADERLSTFFNCVFGLNKPFDSSSSSSERSMNDYQAWLHEARESRDRIDREVNKMATFSERVSLAHPERREQEPTRDDEERPICPYRPIEREVPAEIHPFPFPDIHRYVARFTSPLATLGISLPHVVLTAPIPGQQEPSLPVAYLIFSPYSPARLEQSQALRDHGIPWREAFEDLLAIQTGQNVSTGFSEGPGMSGVDWVLNMIGIAVREQESDMGEKQKASRSTSETIKRKPGFLDRFADSKWPENDPDGNDVDDSDELDEGDDDEQGGLTELDLYYRLLGLGNPDPNPDSVSSAIGRSASRSFSHLQHDSAPAERDSKKPSILSTLTTTEKTTLPDGTVHTKVVLKKKFSDGREESTETMHTQNSVPQAQPQQVAITRDKDGSKNGRTQIGEEKKSKGWFWS